MTGGQIPENIRGVAKLGESMPYIQEGYKFSPTVQIILLAAQAHFETLFQELEDVKETFPQNTEIGIHECRALLGRIVDRTAIGFRNYLEENFRGGDGLALLHTKGELLCDLVELMTGLTRHLISRALEVILVRLHPEDRNLLYPLLQELKAALEDGVFTYQDCRLVLDIVWIREPESADDVGAVELRVRDKDETGSDQPILVTHPYRFAHAKDMNGAKTVKT